jgi:hypothetical protein
VGEYEVFCFGPVCFGLFDLGFCFEGFCLRLFAFGFLMWEALEGKRIAEGKMNC